FGVGLAGYLQGGLAISAVQTGNEIETDFLRAHGFTRARHGAVPKSLRIHLADHAQGASFAFGLALRQDSKVRNFGSHKQHGGSVFARCNARPAPNTSRGVHRVIARILGNRERIAIWRAARVHRDKTASLDNAVESSA